MRISSRSAWIAIVCLVSLCSTVPGAPKAGALTMSPETGAHDVGANPVAIAVGDVDRDGAADLAVANTGSNDVSIVLGDGVGGLRPGRGPLVTGAQPLSVALGDVNRDGILDLATAGSGVSKVHYRLGDGTGAFRALRATPTGSTPPAAMVLADLNGDAKLDVITANPASRTLSVLRGDGKGAFAEAGGSPYSAAVEPDAIAVGDVNEDGRPDAIVSSKTSDGVSVLLGDGFGRLLFASRHLLGTAAVSVRLADVNGDGHLDIVVGRRASNEVAVVAGNGSGAFTAPAIAHALPGDPRAIAVADVNGDAHPDVLAMTGTPSELSILLGDAGGGLAAATRGPWPVGGDGAAVVAPDLNGDGLTDLAIARADAGDVVVRLNASKREIVAAPVRLDFGSQAQGTTSEPRALTLGGSGLPTSIGGVAFEGDGFTVVDDGCTGRTVGDGRASCVISVAFRPTTTGEHAAALHISTDAEDGKVTVPLTGTGIDVDAPDTTITDRPSEETSEVTPTFAFVSSENASTFECSIDAADFTPCTSPHTTTPLPPGSHRFAVRATDAAGNTDPTPAFYTFSVVAPRTVTPETTITEHPPALTNDTTPTFRFISDTAGASFRCSIDAAQSFDCTSPYTATELAEGGHLFSVAARNAAGEIDATPDTYEFSVDITAPRTAISGPARAKRRHARYTFHFSENVAVVRCSIDGSGFSVCKTPFSGRNLRAGKHVLRVQGVDEAGNVEEPPVTKRFRILRGG